MMMEHSLNSRTSEWEQKQHQHADYDLKINFLVHLKNVDLLQKRIRNNDQKNDTDWRKELLQNFVKEKWNVTKLNII